MDRQLNEWKLGIERLWLATAPDYREAERLVFEIAHICADEALRKSATRALPSLRSAAHKHADASTKDLARRRLNVVRDALHVLTVPRFGQRRA
jgi:hypothetical protein